MWWIAVAQAATLSEAWDAAEGSSPERAAAFAAAEAAAARVGQARAAALPKVQLGASYNRADEAVVLDLGGSLPPELVAAGGAAPAIEVQALDWWQASATVVVPLVDAEGWARIGAAARARDAAASSAEASDARVRDAVARAFYGVHLAREAVRIAEESARVATRQRQIAQQRVEIGAGIEREALEARQAELAAERDLHAAVAGRIAAEEGLHRLTGLARDTPVELGFTAELPEGLEAARSAARSHRPELAAAEAQVRAAAASRTAAVVGWLPGLSARGTVQRNGNQGLADDPWFVVGAVEASWGFDGGLRSARAREAGANRAAAESARESAARAIEEEVALILAERDRSRAALAAADQEVIAAGSALEQAERAFEQGAATFVEVERAALRVRAAQLSVARERAAGELATARLLIAVGG